LQRAQCGRSSKRAGIDPAPRRDGPTWRQFLAARAQGILATDFCCVDALLLQRLYIQFFVEHATPACTFSESPQPGQVGSRVQRAAAR
jgi:hypothetical protein